MHTSLPSHKHAKVSPGLSSGILPRQTCFHDISDGPLIKILQLASTDTVGSIHSHAAVCRRWRELVPLAQAKLVLDKDHDSHTTAEVGVARVLQKFSHVSILELSRYELCSDFLLGAIANTCRKLEELSVTVHLHDREEDVEVQDLQTGAPLVPWSAQGLGSLFIVQHSLKSLTLKATPDFLSGSHGMVLARSLSCLTRLESLACKKYASIDAHALGTLSALRKLVLVPEGEASLPNTFTLLTGLTHLRLSNFTALPAGIGCLASLRTLRLDSGFSVTSLPASILSLYCLQCLSLKNMDLEELPGSLLNMPALRALRVRDCSTLKLTSSFFQPRRSYLPLSLELEGYTHPIPEFSANLVSRLHSFTVDRMEYGLPHSVFQLGNLHELHLLNLRSCISLPPLGGLSSLQVLEINSCRVLGGLPADVVSLPNLKKLSLWMCDSFRHLPADIGSMVSLRFLEIGGMPKLSALPDSIADLSSSTHICIHLIDYLKVFPHRLVDHPGLEKWSRIKLQDLVAKNALAAPPPAD